MNRTLLMLGLVLGLLGIAMFLLYVRRFEEERAGGEPIQIVVATRPIARGAPVTEEMLALRTVPLAYVEDRSVKAAEHDKIIGLRSIHPVSVGEALMWTDFTDRSTDKRDLSSLIPPGYRAVYVRATRDDASAALVRPGDWVDVIATMADPSEMAPPSSVVLVQRALVLANGTRTAADPADPDDKTAKGRRDPGLTLALSLQQAQTVAVAATRGQLALVVRGRDDERTYASPPPVGLAALADPKARAAIQLGQYEGLEAPRPEGAP
jgi:pilus assembly protein CpaB